MHQTHDGLATNLQQVYRFIYSFLAALLPLLLLLTALALARAAFCTAGREHQLRALLVLKSC